MVQGASSIKASAQEADVPGATPTAAARDDGDGNTIGSELRGDGGARCGIEGLQG